MWTFLILFGAAALGGAAVFLLQSEFAARGPLAEDKVFLVGAGQSASQIGAALEDAGIISNGRIFALVSQFTGQRSRLKAGEYAIPRGASMRTVMNLMAAGKVITYKISIPEGFTSEMAVARVNANDVLTGPPADIPPEGSILPDTYVFPRGMTRQKIVQDMQAAQAKLIDQLWQARTPVPVIATKDQAVTLASIVEKETAVPEERPLIASVFINRLARGMRLQSDPTIIYGIAGGKGRLDRPLTRADIETTTPYNTYRINGLPPGPIANPGRAALEAVLNPTPTDKLYFVANGSGGHAFAATLEEHNRNVKIWRQIAGNGAAAAAVDDGDNGTGAPAGGAPPPPPAPVPAPDAAGGQGPLADVTPEAPATQPAATDETADAAPEAPQPPAAPAPPPPAPPEAPAATAAASGTAAPADAAAPAAASPPKPRARPPVPVKPAVTAGATPPATDPPAVVLVLKPGTVLTIDGRTTVIPKPRPAP